MGRLVLTELTIMGGRPGRGNNSPTNPEWTLDGAQGQLEMCNGSRSDMIPASKGPRGETLGTRINGTAVPHPAEGQVIGRSSVDARYVIAVDIDF